MPLESTRPPGFERQKHLGLLVGVAASTLICLKLLAVAGWDHDTAFGILAANGTANVLTGTLLAVLPMLYAAFVLAIAPRIEQELKRRTPVERSAARLLETWSVILLIYIAPVGMLLAFAAYVVLHIVLSLVRHIRERRPTKNPQKVATADKGAPSRFEAASAGLGALVILVFGSLSMPWVPPETVALSSGEQTAYVLKNDGDTAIVLLAENRRLVQLETGALTGEYCTRHVGWWNEPIMRLIASDKYPACPD